MSPTPLHLRHWCEAGPMHSCCLCQLLTPPSKNRFPNSRLIRLCNPSCVSQFAALSCTFSCCTLRLCFRDALLHTLVFTSYCLNLPSCHIQNLLNHSSVAPSGLQQLIFTLSCCHLIGWLDICHLNRCASAYSCHNFNINVPGHIKDINPVTYKIAFPPVVFAHIFVVFT